MAEDRSKQKLVIYKDDAKVVEGKIGETDVALTGIEPGTSVANGDYKAAFSDGTRESDRVDVPAFNVPDKTTTTTTTTVKPTTTTTTTVAPTTTTTTTEAPTTTTTTTVSGE